MKQPLAVYLLCFIALSSAHASAARPGDGMPVFSSDWSDGISRDRFSERGNTDRLGATAVATTLVLASYTFNSGASCTAQGWTTVDLTRNAKDYWHVDDFAPSNVLGTIPPGHESDHGLPFVSIQGTKSMWLGQRIPHPNPIDPIHCGYLSLPGYGNDWDQSFCSKDCLTTSAGTTPDLDIAFKLWFDIEPEYESFALEYTTDCSGLTGWIEIDGGNVIWTGVDTLTVARTYSVGPGPVKVRLRLVSNSSGSNQEGIWQGFGVAIDSLSWETTPVEDFEGEAVGSHEANDWETRNVGIGNFFGLFKKHSGASYQEDGCVENLSCYWAAIQGSTDFYTCAIPPQPGQRVVPYGYVEEANGLGKKYVANEIWSPVIPYAGTGSDFRLRYSVYRDLPLDNLVFYQWRVRTIGASGCPGPWQDRNVFYYGDSKDWFTAEHVLGSLLDINAGTGLQVALGVFDLSAWSPWKNMGSGDCHSPAPYIDNVQVLRIDTAGPVWDVRVIDTYQDTFATNGTITGTARIDTAIDIKPAASPTFTPGDSAVVLYLVDPKYAVGFFTNASGLLADPNISTFVGRHKTKKQAYMWVQVWPYDGVDNPGDKVGEELSEGPGGQANRYPFAGTATAGGTLWTKIRMDYTYTGNAFTPGLGTIVPTNPFVVNRFNVDLNDNLFTPGDTILYFYSATSADGTTYYSTEYGATTDINAIAANPMEVTILPAGGFNRGGDLLYVDGADGLGNQAYFEGAFLVLGIEDLIDRYDVRSPSSAMANRLSSRVVDVQQQLNDCYAHITWDCGSLSVTLGDGTGSPLKCDDYGMLNTFLGNLVNPGGLYLSGDDLAENLIASAAPGAATFRSTYMPFVLANGSHRAAGFGVSPAVKFWPGRALVDDFFVFGGCPELNDFDVMNASGTSRVEMSYQTAQSPSGAVVSNKNGDATVVMSGFSFAAIRDDELDGLSDRARFLRNAIRYSGTGPSDPVTGAPRALINSLSQNYPNPFNPATTIAFSLAEKGHVAINVYDVGGRLVRTLANEARDAGSHTVSWDGRDGNGAPVSSGVYFYKLVSGRFSQTKKMVLLK